MSGDETPRRSTWAMQQAAHHTLPPAMKTASNADAGIIARALDAALAAAGSPPEGDGPRRVTVEFDDGGWWLVIDGWDDEATEPTHRNVAGFVLSAPMDMTAPAAIEALRAALAAAGSDPRPPELDVREGDEVSLLGRTTCWVREVDAERRRVYLGDQGWWSFDDVSAVSRGVTEEDRTAGEDG